MPLPFPLLVGLDLATGAECWRTVINPLAIAIPDEAKRKEIEDLWKATIRWRGDYNLLLRDWKAAPADGKDALAERMSALGLKPEGDMKGKGYPSLADAVNPTLMGAPWTKPWNSLGKVGLVGDTWRFHCYGIPGGGWYFGEAFATPISDGKRVYIQLAWGTWAAFDRDGKQLWMQHLPSLGQWR